MVSLKPPKLNTGDTIGIAAPCYVIKPERLEKAVITLESKGFKIKRSENLYSSAHGYSGTVGERAEDFNALFADKDVKMLFFGGGEVCNEILPYIDYGLIKQNPKIVCSYSDSTTILNAIYSMTGLITFYGASPRTFDNLTDYNYRSFKSRLTSFDTSYERSGAWQIICGGSCTGRLIGGFLANFALMQNGKCFSIGKGEKYILFIEDHEMFGSPPAAVSKYFSHIEQSGLFENISGLIFGHYSNEKQPLIDKILERLGKRYGIPVVRSEDFGHGVNNAILPIGLPASLDADKQTLNFLESGVV